jgi:hypothetical protein
VWSGLTWLRLRPLAGCRESRDQPSVSGATEILTYNRIVAYNMLTSALTVRLASCTMDVKGKKKVIKWSR